MASTGSLQMEAGRHRALPSLLQRALASQQALDHREWRFAETRFEPPHESSSGRCHPLTPPAQGTTPESGSR